MASLYKKTALTLGIQLSLSASLSYAWADDGQTVATDTANLKTNSTPVLSRVRGDSLNVATTTPITQPPKQTQTIQPTSLARTPATLPSTLPTTLPKVESVAPTLFFAQPSDSQLSHQASFDTQADTQTNTQTNAQNQIGTQNQTLDNQTDSQFHVDNSVNDDLTNDSSTNIDTQNHQTSNNQNNTTTSTTPQTTPTELIGKLFGNKDTTLSRQQEGRVTQSHNYTNSNSLAQLSNFYQKIPHGRFCQGSWAYQSTQRPINIRDWTAKADYGYYNQKDLAELSGNVVLNQDNKQVVADKLKFNPITGQGYATGNIAFGTFDDDNASSSDTANRSNRFGANDLMGIAKKLAYNVNSEQSSAEQVAFASRSLNAHGYAGSLNQDGIGRYIMDQAMFSTCPPDNRVWQIDADNIVLDSNTGRGTAKHSTLRIKDVPVFYLPYFNFPIDDRRASGFLVPSIGINSNDGLQITTPYYFNLAPNYDATLTPTFYTNRNPRVGAEARYLSRYGFAKVDGAYLPNDKQYNNKDRSHVFFDYTYKPFADVNLDVFAKYRYVSDSSYLSDFDNLGLTNNALNLPRSIGANYSNDFVNASLKVETFQALEGTDSSGNTILDKDRPYARLPQFIAHYRLPNKYLPQSLSGIKVEGISNDAYFKKSIDDGSDTEKSGVRFYNSLSASYPVTRLWGYVNPKVSLSHLYMSYDEDSLATQNLSKAQGTYSVVVPSFSLDMGAYLQKSGSPFGKWLKTGGYQLLSPRLKYVNTPYKDQSQMPNFETSLASIGYEQLLSDTWFLGYDRISDLHAITPAIDYRYIDSQGMTRLHASFAEQIYLDDVDVLLNSDHTAFKKGNTFSAWQTSIQPWQNIWIDVSGSLSNDHNLNAITTALRYQPRADMIFSTGYMERKSNTAIGQLPLSAYTASAVFPFRHNWQIMASTQYDITNRLFMDSLIGVGYEDCCVGISIYGRAYRNDLNPNEEMNRAIMAELRLHGLSGTGKLNSLLKERILGYEPISR